MAEFNLQLPHHLRAGDSIGIIAPSFPSAAWFLRRFERGITALQQTLDLQVIVAEQVRNQDGFTSARVPRRAAELQDFIADPSIKAIFTTIGGFNSAELLPYLDPEVVQRHPKIIIGYSDTTALLLGLQAIGRWVTFYGPAVMAQFGEYPSPFDYTLNCLRALLFESRAEYELQDPNFWTNEFVDWGGEEWLSQPRQRIEVAKRETWKQDEGEGLLYGGNIETLNFLVGTPFFIPPPKMVFFWEATAEEAFLPRIRRALTHLDQIGFLDKVTAMLIGRSPDCETYKGVSLRDVVLDACANYDFPIISNLPFGHTDPMVTLPIGVKCRVSATEGASTIVITGACTS